MGWKPKPLTGKYLARMIKPIEEIWAWRDDFGSNIENTGLDAYGISKKARLRGAKPGHYATIPPEIAFPYLRGALQWVVKFAPIFLEGQQLQWDLEKTQKHLAEGGLDIELTRPAFAERLTPDQVTPDRFLRLTAAACFVVIAGLSARRIGEIMDLGAHCTFVDMDGHHWIRIYIGKTLRTVDQIPIPHRGTPRNQVPRGHQRRGSGGNRRRLALAVQLQTWRAIRSAAPKRRAEQAEPVPRPGHSRTLEIPPAPVSTILRHGLLLAIRAGRHRRARAHT